VPGKKPFFHEAPLSWKAVTMVEPKEDEAGSSSVWCWLLLFVYGSLLSCNGDFPILGLDGVPKITILPFGARGIICVVMSKRSRSEGAMMMLVIVSLQCRVEKNMQNFSCKQFSFYEEKRFTTGIFGL